jgi:DNA repair protein RadD
VTFDNLLSRADDETLQLLIGAPVVRLLRLIDPELATPTRLRELLTQLNTPEELLRDSTARKELLYLLPVKEAEQLAADLGADSVDPYAYLTKLRIRNGSAAEHRLFAFLKVTPSQDEKTEPRPEVESALPDYGLFPHQRAAARSVGKLLSRDPRRALLHMPTGSGKTRTTMNVISDHLRLHEPTLVLWLAYSEELCEQAALEFLDAWQRLGNRPLKVWRFWGGSDFRLEDASDGVVVAGLSKVYNKAKSSVKWLATLADKTSLVIMDEAHQAIAETYALVLNGIEVKQSRTALLGLTATPGRTWNDLDQDEALAKFFARQKVTLNVEAAENPVEYLIAKGYLARPTFEPLHHSGGIELTERDRRELAESLDIPSSLLTKVAEDEQRNLAIIQRVEVLARRHARILVFAATVEHAILLSVVLRARGTDASAVTGSTPSYERQRIIRYYLSGKEGAIVLCNYGVLTTGFDAPRTSAAVIARPSKSLVLYSQMVGRAIRGPRAGGNQEAEIVTVVDYSLPGFGDLGEAFLNWEDVW